MNLSFELTFSDLDSSKQDEMIESVKETLLELYKEEGEGYMKNNWNVAPKTWQEAYRRESAIDWQSWNDLDENSEEFQKFDWDYAIEEFAEDQAKEKCWQGVHNMEVEVEL